MDNDGTARSGPLHQPTNPYDDDAQPSAHRAYRDGWQARWAGEPHTTNPYSDGPDPTVERAWMNGWQAAHLHRAQRPGPS